MGKPLELPALAAGKDEELDAAGALALETDRPIASLVLTTDCMVTEEQEETKAEELAQ